MDHRAFDPGKAFAFLDDVTALFGPYRLPSIEPAWDAAWVVCLTRDPRHESAAQVALASVVVEVKSIFDASDLPQPSAQSARTSR